MPKTESAKLLFFGSLRNYRVGGRPGPRVTMILKIYNDFRVACMSLENEKLLVYTVYAGDSAYFNLAVDLFFIDLAQVFLHN